MPGDRGSAALWERQPGAGFLTWCLGRVRGLDAKFHLASVGFASAGIPRLWRDLGLMAKPPSLGLSLPSHRVERTKAPAARGPTGSGLGQCLPHPLTGSALC